jgi:hypothetical protein
MMRSSVLSSDFRYYIDSEKEIDDNDGKTESTPWKTIAKVNSAPFSPGRIGGEMRIVSFIEEKEVIENFFCHCDLCKDNKPHPPPVLSILLNLIPPVPAEHTILDYNFFERNCA